MSRAEEYEYELERRRREAAFNERVCLKTEEFYGRYLEQYRNMINQGFFDYVPEELKILKENLDEIRSSLNRNEGAIARNQSMRVGEYISSIYSLAREVKKRVEREEENRRIERAVNIKENSNKLLEYFYSQINTITDPIIRDFAIKEIEVIKRKLLNEKIVTEEEFEKRRNKISDEILNIIDRATVKSKEWKNKKNNDNKVKAKKDFIESILESISNEKVDNQEGVDNIKNKLKSIENYIDKKELTEEEIDKKISLAVQEVDDIVISEKVRKEAVKSIIKSLRNQEFIVEKPVIIRNDSTDYVKIVAKKPSGKRVDCRICSDGKIKYKFDKYDGMSCLKDIEKFNVDLEEIYSIKLSNQKILWENPIRISKDSKPITNDIERKF